MKPPVKPAFQPPESRAGSAATGLTQGNARPAFPAVLRRNELSAQERKSPGQSVARGSVAVAGREPRRPAGTAHLSAPDAHGGFFAARQKMLQQLMRSGVTDPRVLAAMSTVERHRFVDTALASQGYEDTSLPIGLGQTISKPNVVARMLELLCADSTTKLGRVLEIGTGCGYQAAVLSHLASEVYSIERLRGLHERAIDNLRFMRLPNVHLLFGDGMLGYPRGAPYAAIIAAAGGEAIPAVWIDQLAVGGRLVAPVKVNAGEQALVLVKKTARGVTRSQLEPVQFVPLKSGTSA